jgi:hypothetical protein
MGCTTGVRGSITGKGRECSLRHYIQIGCETYRASYPVCIGGGVHLLRITAAEARS